MDETREWLAALGVLTGGELLTDEDLAELAAGVLDAFPPGWRPWAGVSPARPFYARRPGTSPPWWVHGKTLAAVAAKARRRERAYQRRWARGHLSSV